MKPTKLLLSALLISTASMAQEAITPADSSVNPLAGENYATSIFNRPSSLGFEIGTQGIGLDYHIRVSQKWELKAGVTWMPTLSQKKYYADLEATADLKANFSNAHVIAGYRIFDGSSKKFWNAIQLQAGLGIFFSSNVKGKGTTDKELNYGEILIDQNRIGTMEGTVQWSAVAPYAGFSFLQSIPVEGFSVSVDAGAYYIGKPNVSVSGTNYLKNNQEFEEGLKNNLSGYRWYPVLQIGINYRINSLKPNTDNQQ